MNRKEYMRVYRKTHKEEIAAQKKEYHNRKAEYLKDKSRQYRRTHKEEIAEKDRALRKKKRELIRMQNQQYYKDNIQVFRDLNMKRRALERGNIVLGDQKKRRDIYRLAASSIEIPCYLCGKTTRKGEREVDHVIPLSRRGKHSSDNLRIACSFCNRSKYNSIIPQIAAEIIGAIMEADNDL